MTLFWTSANGFNSQWNQSRLMFILGWIFIAWPQEKKTVIHKTWIFVGKNAKIARFQGRNLWKLPYLDNMFQYVVKYIFKFTIYLFSSFDEL
jgi:hypothetical protein